MRNALSFTLWRVEHTDALQLLETLPDASVDCVITDPPYDALDTHRARGTTTRLVKRWFPTIPNTEVVAILRECYRVLKPKTHCYVMVSYGGVWDLKALIEAETDFVIPKSLIWDKVSIGMGYNYRAQHEHILFCKKGKRPVNNRGLGDVLRYKRIHPTHASWPTAKPVDMLRVLVTQSTEPGDLVLDPFSGSGATGVAALTEGREFLGCDILEEAVELSRKALQDCATIQP